jgi:hypothetical protein
MPRTIERSFVVGQRVRHLFDLPEIPGTVTKVWPESGPPEWYDVDWDAQKDHPAPNQYMWMVLDAVPV